MSLTIDGLPFDNSISIEQATQYATVESARSLGKILSIERFSATGSPIGFSVQLKGATARQLISQLQGIADRRGVVIITSNLQKLWGDELQVYMAIKSYQPAERGPYLYGGSITGEFQGTPRTTPAVYRVASVQLEQDFGIEGRTIIPIPPGSTAVSHPVTAREGQNAIVAHADWDGNGLSVGSSRRAKVLFTAAPATFYDDVCKVFDGTTRIMGTTFTRAGNVTIENGFTRIVIDFSLQRLDYYFKVASVFTLKERFTLQAFTDFNLIFNENDYVAGQFNTGEYLELWRGKDFVVSNTTQGSFAYVTSAAPGAQQNTSGSTNFLQIAASGVYVASQRMFKITTGKQIRIQVSGDPTPAGHATDARYMITATAENITNRAKEILKRQA